MINKLRPLKNLRGHRDNIIYPALALMLLPLTASAQIETVGDIIGELGNLISTAFPVVIGAALLGFFWGLAQYVWKAGDKEAQEKGKRIMIAGIVSLFLIAAIGGIVDVLLSSFDLTGNETIPVPGVGTNS